MQPTSLALSSPSDGDTIEVLHYTHPERVRLSGIDCPEKGQPYGTRAKQALSALVFGKDVILQTHGQDKYGRTFSAGNSGPDRRRGTENEQNQKQALPP